VRIDQLDVPVSMLGEGPVWSDRDGCLYYVDIPSFRLHSYAPNNRRHRFWQFDTYVGSLAECESGGLIVALGDRLVRFDPEKGEGALEQLVVLERDVPENRLNDGKVDPWGRFWVGSMRLAEDAASARLWCVSPSGKAELVREHIVCSNSIAFDRSRGRMYFADSASGLIERSDFDAERRLTGFEPFARAGKGAPDGSTTDAEGCLWNAEWGGFRLCRYAPDGSLERVIDMPTSRPSCCAFGGANHRTLFVTSARIGMSPEELERDPNAGGLFSVELDDVEGLPADLFGI
jgi:sugar lactone lactonase YvrE